MATFFQRMMDRPSSVVASQKIGHGVVFGHEST